MWVYAIPSDKLKKDIIDSLNIMVKKGISRSFCTNSSYAVQNVNQNIFKYIIDEYFHQK